MRDVVWKMTVDAPGADGRGAVPLKSRYALKGRDSEGQGWKAMAHECHHSVPSTCRGERGFRVLLLLLLGTLRIVP